MHTAVKITKEAKGSTFDQCEVFGCVKNEGKNTKFIKTRIRLSNLVKDHPIIYGSISAVVGGLIVAFVEYYFFK